MATRCRFCDTAMKKSQPTVRHEIHDVTYMVHMACRDQFAPPFKNAGDRWNHTTKRIKA